MSETSREHLHKEHRKRVKERFLRSGLEDFSPHEVLELILFYAVPQKDTNELGHRLINHFGSLSQVFHASYEELLEVDGIGEHAATLLRLWLPAASCVLASDQEKRINTIFNTVNRVGEYLITRYIGTRNETVYLMLLDNRYALIDCVRVHEGAVNSVGITPRRLIEIAFRNNASMAVLAHNHPGGMAVPSMEDVGTTISLRDAFEAVGIPLIEHILVAGNKYTPIMLRSQNTLAAAPEKPAFYADYTFKQEDQA